MTSPTPVSILADAGQNLATAKGTLVVFADGAGALGAAALKVDAAAGGMLARAVADPDTKPKAGVLRAFPYPAGHAARQVILACLGPNPDRAAVRETGSAIAKALGKDGATLCMAGVADDALTAELVWALTLRLYDFTTYKTVDDKDAQPKPRKIRVLGANPNSLKRTWAPFKALADGIFFTRDLVNEPANTLTTEEFATRLVALTRLGLEVEVLDEPELKKLGAGALLAVGQGSPTGTKIVVMKWMGGKKRQKPLALVGKGVVFDTGGISIKPSGGMEEMTMDMGGAGVVAGVMRTLALRKAKANVIGVVGLVENMPDGLATRPGDIVKSMKGDTIEVINTDAEGRLVLCDALWYTQKTFQPLAVIDLATLTGAVIVALGNHRAGYYANDDAFAAELEAASGAVGDDAWRMPLGKPYADQLKSHLADIKNTGGRQAGSITAAEFLHRFIEDGMPWIHIDIAGVTLASGGTVLAPKGATGWGVAALDALIRDKLEG